MRFSFVGDLTFNTKEDAKVPAVREIGEGGIGINATVVSSKNNRAFVEVTGWKNDEIKTKDTDFKDIVIDWADRKDKDIIKKVSNTRKNVIVLGEDERYEFITSYDFCKFIAKNIDELNGKRFLVTGQTNEDFYGGKESKRFQINCLYSIDEDSERKNKLEMNPTVVYFTKDSIDAADFKEDKKIYINGYTQEFISKKDLGGSKGENRYVPQQFILDCSKIDFDDEDHVKRMNFNLCNLGLKYKDGKIVNGLKGTKYYANEIKVLFINGAQDVGDAEEITYDMLTDMQKLKCDLGMAVPSDFATKGHVYGPRVVEFRITDFPMKNDYADGLVTLDSTVDEFEEMIFMPVSNDSENIDDDELPFDDEDDDDDDFDMPKPKKSKKNEDDEEDEIKPKRSSKKKAVEEDEEEEVKPKRTKKKAVVDDGDDKEDEEVKPKKKPVKDEDDEDDDEEDWDTIFGGDNE